MASRLEADRAALALKEAGSELCAASSSDAQLQRQVPCALMINGCSVEYESMPTQGNMLNLLIGSLTTENMIAFFSGALQPK